MKHSIAKTLLAALVPALAATAFAQPPQEADQAAQKAAAAAEAVLKKLPSIPGASEAKVINIHIGDNITFGFDEGVDAEEWGMTENNADAAGGAVQGAKPAAPADRPTGYRKIDFRKGDLVLLATEDTSAGSEKPKDGEPAPAAQP